MKKLINGTGREVENMNTESWKDMFDKVTCVEILSKAEKNVREAEAKELETKRTLELKQDELEILAEDKAIRRKQWVINAVLSSIVVVGGIFIEKTDIPGKIFTDSIKRFGKKDEY